MDDNGRRKPAGAALLQQVVSDALTDAVLDELADGGFGRLSMERVAKRAQVSKSALYRRWTTKEEMVVATISTISVPIAEVGDTGSLRGDVRAMLEAMTRWLTHPRLARIMPDISAESTRNTVLADTMLAMVREPRLAHARATLQRAVERGEIPTETDMKLAMDLLAAPAYWRLIILQEQLDQNYLKHLEEVILFTLSGNLTE